MSSNNTKIYKKNPKIRQWQVMEVELQNGTRSRHIWGHDVTNNLGCVSTAIKHFDIETMNVTTVSGNVYTLLGTPKYSRTWELVWLNWRRTYGVLAEVNVTNEYFNIDAILVGVREDKE